MVASVHQNEYEARRQQILKKERQTKIHEETKRGVIINSIVKDSINSNQNDLLRDYIIPNEIKKPDDLKKDLPPVSSNQPLTKLCLGTLGVTGAIAGITKLVSLAAKKQFQTPKFDSLPDIGRNMNLNEESHFVTYMMVQSPQRKTIIGASAFFVFAATGFILKNFADGFRDIWIKKQYAKADYELQDNLIEVETKVFKGKNDIIRTMMKDTATELDISMKEKKIKNSPNFKGESDEKSSVATVKKPKDDKLITGLAVVGTVVGTALLGFLSFKNIKKTDEIIQKSSDDLHKEIGNILNKTPDDILKNNKETLKNIFSIMNFKPKEIEEKLRKAKIPENEIKEITDSVTERTKTFSQAPKEIGGHVGKVQYFTFIQDARGHFYNWVMNLDSKPLRALALGISGVTAVGYCGEQAVNAVREVEVKKMNNETELNLQKKLINVELRNFTRKKESYVKPLIQEFKRQAPDSNTEKLDDMAQNILYEIKNGPPFVYA